MCIKKKQKRILHKIKDGSYAITGWIVFNFLDFHWRGIEIPINLRGHWLTLKFYIFHYTHLHMSILCSFRALLNKKYTDACTCMLNYTSATATSTEWYLCVILGTRVSLAVLPSVTWVPNIDQLLAKAQVKEQLSLSFHCVFLKNSVQIKTVQKYFMYTVNLHYS